MLLTYCLLLLGFLVLIVAGDLLVRGAVSLALFFGISPLVIGLTIVGFGTSAPELVVSLDAALAASTDMAIGNVVGSNIANLLLVLGLPALIAPTNCDQTGIERNMLYVLAATAVFIALCFFGYLHIWQGILLLLMLAFILVSTARRSPRDITADIEDEAQHKKSVWLQVLFVVIGLVGLPIGAHLIVTSGSEIARTFGVSEMVIGLTLVALGTSLPELAATTMAAFRGQAGLALGNVLGSCLFNLLAIMGITMLIVPVPVPEALMKFDIWVMLAATLVLTPVFLRRAKITRAMGAALLIVYMAYIVAVFIPGPHSVALAAL
ncbi:MAG: calcium/sodium antiporter [Hyphomicrobiales bacterium]